MTTNSESCFHQAEKSLKGPDTLLYMSGLLHKDPIQSHFTRLELSNLLISFGDCKKKTVLVLQTISNHFV